MPWAVQGFMKPKSTAKNPARRVLPAKQDAAPRRNGSNNNSINHGRAESMLPTLDPIKSLPEGSYVTRNLKCVRCGAVLPNAPWPVDNPSIEYRPGCPYCGSRMTFPIAGDKEVGPWPYKVPPV